LKPEPHVVTGRVQISAVTQPLKLAEPNPISLNSNGPKVTSVIAGWGYYVRGGVMHPVNVNDDILPVSYDSRGGASVNVTPRRLGKVQLTLFVTFEDGGFERKKIDLQVGPSERPPEKLVITPGGGDTSMNHPVISLDLSDAHRTRYLNPSAIFKNVTSPVRLLPLEVTFRFISPLGTDAGIGTAAEIDPSTGILTARYVGQALLETTFEGVSVLTCIDVMKNVGGGRSSRCEEILPPGRSLPPDLHDLYPGPPPVAVKPPPRANTNPQ
jgi:hypothetical protein